MLNVGTIDLVLMTAPYSVPASPAVPVFDFDDQSYRPAVKYRALTDASGITITRINSQICSQTGLSVVELNPALITGSPAGHVSNVGGRDCLYMSTGGVFEYRFQSSWHQPTDVTNEAEFQSFLISGRGLFDQLSNAPLNFSNGGIGVSNPGFLYGTSSATYNGAVIQKNTGLEFHDGAFEVVGFNISQLWSGSSVYQCAYGDRNYFFFTAATLHDPLYGHYDLSLGPASVLPVTPVFPDAVLQAALLAGDYTVKVYKNGFVFVFDTNGTGPTGQRFEVALVRYDFAYMALLRFIAGDPTAKTALARTSAVDWKVKPDTDGIVYWNSGHAADILNVWFSQPVTVHAPSGQIPYSLPCYTPCYPDPIGVI